MSLEVNSPTRVGSRPSSGRPSVACVIGILSAVLASSLALGQSPKEDDPPGNPVAQTLEQFQGLWKEFEKLGDWEDQTELIHETMDRFWSENEWSSEADQFARKLAGEVAAIPPWDVTGRVSKMTELVSGRYDFTEAQSGRLQASVYSEAGWFLVRNRKVLWHQTRDFLSKYSAGEPLTAEQVAEWTRESEPLMRDLRERMDRMVKSLEKTMSPRQRAILKRDLESLERRQAFTDQMRRRWADGGWEPRDWGLENDPAYANWRPDPRQQQIARRRAAIRAARERRERVEAVDETTWARYVREFIRKYQLDDGQTRTANSMLRELQVRARDYKETRREELAGLARYQLANSPLGEPLRRMFEELKARLQPIPTAAQREAAETNPP